MKQELFEIAKRNIYGLEERGDLEQRFIDSEDFLDVAVWSIRKLLKEAYELGKQDSKNK
ncbi:DUF6900 domain-containing protein [Clostridium perfringens]|uniref:DUF6900 domain-containing protein n=1 Tax=Clostridium perfringens TaxID=1502 RepID=UPI0039EB2CF4